MNTHSGRNAKWLKPEMGADSLNLGFPLERSPKFESEPLREKELFNAASGRSRILLGASQTKLISVEEDAAKQVV